MSKPTFDDWRRALPEHKIIAGELVGPCPACGGTDRWHCRRDGLVGCRNCDNWEAMLRGAGLWIENEPARRLNGHSDSSISESELMADWHEYQQHAHAGHEQQQPDHVWIYHSRHGNSFEVCRNNATANQPKKRVWQRPAGVKLDTGDQWLPYIAGGTLHDAPFLIVEGERTADLVNDKLGGQYNVLTWQRNPADTSWDLIQDQTVIIWPDNDEPGRKKARQIHKLISPLASSIRMVGAVGNESDDAADFIQRGDDLAVIIDSARERKTGFEMVPACDIQMRAIEWLVPHWIPKRAITLIAGQPGQGKTTLAIALAAAVSQGGVWGRETAEQGNVIIYSGEDTLPEIIVPNLRASQSDMKRIHFPIHGADKDGLQEAFHPAKHLHQLRAALRNHPNTKLVILDPALALAANAKDEYRASDIRKSLEPVQELVEELNLSAVCITHFLKAHNSRGSGMLDRVIGSQAWGAVARMVIGVEKKDGSRIAMRVKSNWGSDDGGFEFDILSRQIEPDIYGKTIEFGDAITGTADEVFGSPVAMRPDTPAKDTAIDWLLEFLPEHPNGLRWEEICKSAKADSDITAKTIRNARDELKQRGKIRCKRISSEKGAIFVWMLAN